MAYSFLLLVAFTAQLCTELHSTQESWLWTRDSYLDDKQLSSFHLATEVYKNISECVLMCLQRPKCLSFFVQELTSGEQQCSFHNKIFSTWEVDNFGQSVPGSRHFKIESGCPASAMYYFFRVGKMCIRLVTATSLDAFTATDDCEAAGERLAVIDNEIKRQFVTQVLMSSTGYSTREYHVGAKVNLGVTGQYDWTNGAVVPGYFFDPADPLSETCVFISVSASGEVVGRTIACASKLNYICELVLA